MKSKLLLFLGLFLLPILIARSQNLAFDNLTGNGGQGKAISWTTSLFGNGFGHRIVNVDPGELTTLNFQTRHNTTTWTNVLVLTSTGNVGIGVSNPTSKFEVNGTIKTREVNVTTAGWADYVFDPGYKLMPLSEVEAFIQKNGHLPNMPSEKEVLEGQGVNLMEMNVKLLEKIEELTLYMIDQQKIIEQLKSKIE